MPTLSHATGATGEIGNFDQIRIFFRPICTNPPPPNLLIAPSTQVRVIFQTLEQQNLLIYHCASFEPY